LAIVIEDGNLKDLTTYDVLPQEQSIWSLHGEDDIHRSPCGYFRVLRRGTFGTTIALNAKPPHCCAALREPQPSFKLRVG
jgi:hypothetical protein